MKRPNKAKPKKEPAKADEPVSVVCSPLSRQPVPAVAAVQALCGQCRQPVWFSYSSAVALGNQVYECVCTDCALTRFEAAQARGEPLDISPLTPMQRAEITDVLRRDGRGGSLFTDS